MANIVVSLCVFIVISMAIRAHSLKCSKNRCSNVFQTNCRCDKDCYFYRDCCLDSPFRIQQYGRRNDVTCMNATGDSVFIIRGCSEAWTEPYLIEQMCLHPTRSWKDPLIHAPVTSLNTNLTYRNAFCALCNGDCENTATWKVMVWCPSTEVSAVKKDPYAMMSYNSEVRRWGYYTWNKTIGENTFHACIVSFGVPNSLAEMVRHCDMKEVNRCYSRFSDGRTKKFCMSYQDPVYDKRTGIRYRNAHCATCNLVNHENLRCAEHFRISPARTLNNFAVIFGRGLTEVRFMRSMAVNKPHCPTKQVYDEFSSKCRRVICEIPGLVIKNCS